MQERLRDINFSFVYTLNISNNCRRPRSPTKGWLLHHTTPSHGWPVAEPVDVIGRKFGGEEIEVCVPSMELPFWAFNKSNGEGCLLAAPASRAAASCWNKWRDNDRSCAMAHD